MLPMGLLVLWPEAQPGHIQISKPSFIVWKTQTHSILLLSTTSTPELLAQPFPCLNAKIQTLKSTFKTKLSGKISSNIKYPCSGFKSTAVLTVTHI